MQVATATNLYSTADLGQRPAAALRVDDPSSQRPARERLQQSGQQRNADGQGSPSSSGDGSGKQLVRRSDTTIYQYKARRGIAAYLHTAPFTPPLAASSAGYSGVDLYA